MQLDLDKRRIEKNKRLEDKYKPRQHNREQSNDEIYGVNVMNRSKLSNLANAGGSAHGGITSSASAQQLGKGGSKHAALSVQQELQRNFGAHSQYSKEREDFSNKLKQLRDKMNQDSRAVSTALSPETRGRDAKTDVDDDYYRIKSPVKKPDLSRKPVNTASKSSVQDMSETQRLEDSINQRLQEFEQEQQARKKAMQQII